MLDEYTSTGLKFFRHPTQLGNYLHGYPGSIISTHISPEGKCNLDCEYCCQKNRNKIESIHPDVLEKYIGYIKENGCKAVILTGGGEPTLYPHFKWLMDLLSKSGMQYAIITNGTTLFSKEIWKYPFTWIRISVNGSAYWRRKFMNNKHHFQPGTTIGLSFVYSGVNKLIKPQELLFYADHIRAQYIRLIPDTTLNNDDLHKEYAEMLLWLGDFIKNKIFLVQPKFHQAPDQGICHQSYFRPFLSDIEGGTIFPCDAIALNDKTGKFDMKYSLCSAQGIKLFMDRKMFQRFDATKDCQGCPFTNTINVLDRFIKTGSYGYIKESIKHENFV